MGLPRLWGRVGGGDETIIGPDTGDRGKDDGEPSAVARLKKLNALWTLAYYILLIGGAVGFYKNLWLMTESTAALVDFGVKTA